MKKLSLILIANFISHLDIWAQGCSMCTATAGNLSTEKAEGLNLGIIYLAIMPITLIISIGLWWYKKSKNSGTL